MKQFRTKEVTYARRSPRQARRATLAPTGAFTATLDRWLDQAAAGVMEVAPAMRRARRLCGRWLALRRLCLGLSDAAMVEGTGVNAQTLRWLELGLADATLVADEVWEPLCRTLAGGTVDVDWVAAVIDTALGRRDAHVEPVIERVTIELQQIVTVGLRER